MILIDNFAQVIAQIENERGIEKNSIISALEQSLVSAAKRKFSEDLNVFASIEPDSGETNVWVDKTVVDTYSENKENELLLDAAKAINPAVSINDTIREDLSPGSFGRLAAQTAKQVILQCIREAEKDLVLKEFTDKIGTLVTGTVQNIEGNTYLINLGKVEAFLNPYDQIKNESFNVKDRIRVYVVDINKTTRGPAIKISRSHSGLVRELFRLEVPEIDDGIIKIKSISRDPGNRTKVAVQSTNENVGAVGTCVGHMGGRIQSILKELNNEKIDILEWHEDPVQFIKNSLKPATITRVTITNPDKKEATVSVPSDQLSLAIGRGGSNVRLAVKLTGYNLDVVDDSVDGQQNAPPEGLLDRLKKDTSNQPETNDQTDGSDSESTAGSEHLNDADPPDELPSPTTGKTNGTDTQTTELSEDKPGST